MARAFRLAYLVAVSATFIAGQQFRSSITGRVLDPSDAVIAGVKITAPRQLDALQ